VATAIPVRWGGLKLIVLFASSSHSAVVWPKCQARGSVASAHEVDFRDHPWSKGGRK